MRYKSLLTWKKITLLIFIIALSLGLGIGLGDKHINVNNDFKYGNYSSDGYVQIGLGDIDQKFNWDYSYYKGGGYNHNGFGETYDPPDDPPIISKPFYATCAGFDFFHLENYKYQTPTYLNNHLFNIMGNSSNVYLGMIFDNCSSNFVHNKVRFAIGPSVNKNKKFNFDFKYNDINGFNESGYIQHQVWAVNENGYPIDLYIDGTKSSHFYLYLYFLQGQCMLRFFDASTLTAVDYGFATPPDPSNPNAPNPNVADPFYTDENGINVDSLLYSSSTSVAFNYDDYKDSDFWVKWI